LWNITLPLRTSSQTKPVAPFAFSWKVAVRRFRLILALVIFVWVGVVQLSAIVPANALVKSLAIIGRQCAGRFENLK
jgi:hypothetical protein